MAKHPYYTVQLFYDNKWNNHSYFDALEDALAEFNVKAPHCSTRIIKEDKVIKLAESLKN